MKKILTKVSYMAFGSLLTLIGYHFGNIDNNSANAQETFRVGERGPITDEIRCRKLLIVGADGTPRVILKTDSTDHGRIQIYNENGARRIDLAVTADFDSGTIRIAGKESGGEAVQLGVDNYGGYMALYNTVSDNSVLQTGVTGKGEGVVFTRDKVGNHTWWSVGSKGTRMGNHIRRSD